jgi:four helix bundle protein
MNNIAEGFGRYHRKEFIQFLDYSQSSCQEVKSMIYILYDRQYINQVESENCLEQSEKTKSMILALIKYIRTDLNKSTE